MNKRSEQIRLLRKKGLTYAEIGEIYGVSKQAIKQAEFRNGFRPSAVRKVRYKGLRNWMFEHQINVATLSELCGFSRTPCGSIMIGGKSDPSKKTIDAILKATGLTYEECFGIELDGTEEVENSD